jgi:hypothetical protein
VFFENEIQVSDFFERDLEGLGTLEKVYNLDERNGTFDQVGIELGLYFVALTFCMLKLLDEVRGKPSKLKKWIYYRKLIIFGKDKGNSDRVVKYLTYTLYYFMVMPAICLIAWSVLVGYSNDKDGHPLWSAVCILILGICFMLFGYNLLKIKWTNYRFKTSNFMMLLTCMFLFMLYQFLMVFGYDHTDKFLPFSAVFLNLNVTILAIYVFLTSTKD